MTIHIYRSKSTSWYPMYQRYDYDDNFLDIVIEPRNNMWAANRLALFQEYSDGKYRFYV